MSLVKSLAHFFGSRPAYRRLRDPFVSQEEGAAGGGEDELDGDAAILMQGQDDALLRTWNRRICDHVARNQEAFGPAAISLGQLNGSSVGIICETLAQTCLARFQSPRGCARVVEAVCTLSPAGEQTAAAAVLETLLVVESPAAAGESSWRTLVQTPTGEGEEREHFWVNLLDTFELLYIATLFVDPDIGDALVAFVSVYGRQLEYLDASGQAPQQPTQQPAHWVALTSSESRLTTFVDKIVCDTFDTETIATMDFLHAFRVSCIPLRIVQAMASLSQCKALETAAATRLDQDQGQAENWQLLPLWPVLLWQQQQGLK